MRKIFILSVLGLIILTGCAQTSETAKVLWGSSTRALEKERNGNAATETFSCSFGECYEAVLKVAQEEEWAVFINDRAQRHMFIMGIKGSVDTTEVGIFFDPQSQSDTKIDITSLSSSARQKVSERLFSQLRKIFP